MSANHVRQNSRKEHRKKPCNTKDAPAEKHGNWRKVYISSKIKATFYSPTEERATLAPSSKNSRGTRIRGRLWSINAHAEQKGFELRGTGYSSIVHERHNGGNGQRGSASERGSTGKCLRSWSLRNSAVTRGHACSPIAWRALRRARLHVWVGQRSKATVDQTREETFMQDGRFRTSCCPGIVVKFWRQLVFCIATAGLIKNIFKSSRSAKWRRGTGKPARSTKSSKQKKEGQRWGSEKTVCEIFQNGWRSSQIISKRQKCRRPHTFLMDTDSERPTKVASKKHRIFTQFQKDGNCDICMRTKITGAPCRKRTTDAVHRAEKFGDLTTADHKVLNEGD